MQAHQISSQPSAASSEKIRSAVNRLKLRPSQKLLLTEVAIGAALWANATRPNSVARTNQQLAAKVGVSIRQIKNLTRELREAGYIEIETIQRYCEASAGYVDKENRFTVTPLLYLLAEREALLVSSCRLSAQGEDADAKLEAIKELDVRIEASLKASTLRPLRRESVRGARAAAVKKLKQQKTAAERGLRDALASGSLDDARKAQALCDQLSDSIETILSSPINLDDYRPLKPDYFFAESEPKLHDLVQSISPPSAIHFTTPCNEVHHVVKPIAHIPNLFPKLNQNLIPNTHSDRAPTYAYKGNDPATEQGVSEVFNQLTALDVFDRFSNAVKQAGETKQACEQLAMTIYKDARGDVQKVQEEVVQVVKTLEFIESVPELQNAPENGLTHSLGRLLCHKSIEGLERSLRLKALRSVANRTQSKFNGEVGRGRAIVELALRSGWDPVQTFNWLTDKPATESELQAIAACAAELNGVRPSDSSTEALETRASSGFLMPFEPEQSSESSQEALSGWELALGDGVTEPQSQEGLKGGEKAPVEQDPSSEQELLTLDQRAKNACREVANSQLELLKLYTEFMNLTDVYTQLAFVRKLEGRSEKSS